MGNHSRGFVSISGFLLVAGSLGLVACAVGAGADPSEEPTPGVGQGGDSSPAGAGGGSEYLPCGIDCSQIETAACHSAVCNEKTGKCSVVAVGDGTACEDGKFCTVNDSCVGGQCTAGEPNDCGLSPEACQEAVCSEQSQQCTIAAKTESTSCTPDDLCKSNGSCIAGVCVGEPKNCTFAPVPDDCHIAQCNPANGNCEPVSGNEGLPCTDSTDLCTVNKVCASGACQGGIPKDCSQLTQGCQKGVCDTYTGNCTQQAIADGGPCDDLDPCTSSETCQSGVCTAGSQVSVCTNNDNCCPSTCNDTNDNDCAVKVMLGGYGYDVAAWDAYRNALSAAGVSWTEHNIYDLGFPTATDLLQYNVIVCFADGAPYALDSESQILVDWLNLGGRNLFVTGIDVMWSFQGGTPGLGAHNLYSALSTVYLGDYAGQTIPTIDGLSGDPITGDFATPNGLLLAGSYYADGDYADETLGSATHAGLYAAGGTGSGHSALSHHDNGTYKTVWLGVNFHNGLSSPTQRHQLMTNIINFFKN